MPLHYINKDITTVEYGIVAHGVNAQKRMASGVAKAIKAKWPLVYERYRQNGSGEKVLGTVDFINVDPLNEEIWVANCYTQLFYGYGGGKYADVESIDSSLEITFEFAQSIALPLYMPKIGSGLGGLSWEEDVLPIVEQYVTTYPNVDTYVCDFNPNLENSK